ncbi:MAG TPA: Uma2 family endonuclease [Methylothermaceae bacterium]|nr:Uma2 family endonuclease [Methylothermaceae bacterium]
MVVNPHAQARRWTYRDYLTLDDGKRYEILEGELRDMTPAPSVPHQSCSRNLEFLFLEYVRLHNWGFVYDAPIDVILSEENVLQPDIVLIADERRDIIRDRGIFGAPDVVVEIVSPSSVRYDYVTKQAIYQRFGIAEYWLVDPANRSVTVLGLEEGQYQPIAFASGSGTVQSRRLPQFTVELGAIFSER